MADDALNEAPPPPVMSGEESLEELRAILWRTHGISVDAHDPVLMVNTIHRVALKDFERMLDGQARRFSDAGGAVADKLATDISGTIEELKTKALNDALRERLMTINETAQLTTETVKKFRKTFRQLVWLTLANYLAVTVTLGILALLIF
ncbi:MAG: hypothetical protein RIC16_03825 [Rhodospirillales bacterium]